MLPQALIGLTSSRQENASGNASMRVMEDYVQALARAGAAPVLIPLGLSEQSLELVLNRLDGILFTGGGDIQTALTGGPDHPRVSEVDPDRDRVELYLARAAISRKLPLLGICRGLQLLNVALGGTLYTHVADQLPQAIKHDYSPGYRRDFLSHSVHIQPDSQLAGILGSSELKVNSLHHQGIHTLAEHLQPAAWSPDGLVEGFEILNYSFGLAVQWHPECLQEHASMRTLFAAFVDACRAHPSNA
jgi:putative glutamine amidotransferase